MEEIIEYIKRMQSIAETGSHYSKNPFELNRNKEISNLCIDILEKLSNVKMEEIRLHLEENNGYKTPKVDIRAVVFDKDDKLLLVKEMVDGKWSLPGGWADIGFSPSEIAVKETLEEAGYIVEPLRLLAVMDKRCHKHPPDLYYIYKIFLECKLVSKSVSDGMETSDNGFFNEHELPDLSTPRNTLEQIKMLFDFRKGINTPPYFD